MGVVGLAEHLRAALDAEHAVVATVHDATVLPLAVRAVRPDVIVVDTTMPRFSASSAMRHMRRGAPGVSVIFLALGGDAAGRTAALAAGARGYVARDSAIDEIREALRTVCAGGIYASPSLAPGAAPMPHALTQRQRQILLLIAQGHTVKRIARAVGVSPKTVEFHKYRMMERLDAKSTAALVLYAVSHGIVAG